VLQDVAAIVPLRPAPPECLDSGIRCAAPE
jgi:hypothetical protein